MPSVSQLINYLTMNNHISSNRPVTSTDLALHFGISDGGVEVEMRSVIREAINQGELIGSTNRGYYLIGTLAELEENLLSLEGRAEGTLHRRNTMRAIWNRQNPSNQTLQPDLFVRP